MSGTRLPLRNDATEWLKDWLRRNAEGQSMEDPSQAIQMLLDALDEES